VGRKLGRGRLCGRQLKRGKLWLSKYSLVRGQLSRSRLVDGRQLSRSRLGCGKQLSGGQLSRLKQAGVWKAAGQNKAGGVEGS